MRRFALPDMRCNITKLGQLRQWYWQHKRKTQQSKIAQKQTGFLTEIAQHTIGGKNFHLPKNSTERVNR